MTLLVHQLFADLDVNVEGPDAAVQAFTCDSRAVKPGACFAALSGERLDGHDFMPQALAAGATSILCERVVPTPGATRIVAKHARHVLAIAARRFFGNPSEALAALQKMASGPWGADAAEELERRRSQTVGIGNCGIIARADADVQTDSHARRRRTDRWR